MRGRGRSRRQPANGRTTTETQPKTAARCKKLAEAGAADLTLEVPEPETYGWCILQDTDFNPRRKDSHMAHAHGLAVGRPSELENKARVWMNLLTT